MTSLSSRERWFVIIANNRGEKLIPMVEAEYPHILALFPTREKAVEAASGNALARAAGAEVFRYGDGEFV